MPSKSKAQYKLFEIASYNKEFAEKRGMDQEQAREWHKEDKAKRKDDPDWYDALPEKADGKDDDKEDKGDKKDKKAKKGDESMEGMISDVIGSIKSFFSSGTAKEKDNHELYESPWQFVMDAEKLVNETYSNKKWLDEVETIEGMIKGSDLGPLLRFPSWPKNILDGIEKGVSDLERFMKDFSKAMNVYMGKLEPLYEEAISADNFVDAKAKFYAGQAKISGPMNSLKIPTGTLGNFQLVVKNQIFHSITTSAVAGPANIPALSKNEIAKAGALMGRVFSIIDDAQTFNEWWFPDVFKDIKKAMHSEQWEDGSQETAFYQITRLADNSYDPENYYYDQPIIDQLINTAMALNKMIERSVK